MLSCWLTIAALLMHSGAAAGGQPTVTLAPPYRVKGQPGVELTLNCGDGNNSRGVVKFWNTPFGAVHTAVSVHAAHLEPVLLQQDGSLLLPNISSAHSGLYYCLLEEGGARTLRPTVLNIGTRTRTRTSSVPGVPQSHYIAAIASSVLLSFMLGFSSGAMSRTHVLRCLSAVAKRMRLPRRRRSYSDEPDRGVAMVTVPPSETSPNPPTKPQRSFRHRSTDHAVEERQTAAYLESCDHVKNEERKDAGKEEEEERKEEESRTEEEVDENQEEGLTEEEEAEEDRKQEESQTEEEKEEEDRKQEESQTEEEKEEEDRKQEESQTEEEKEEDRKQEESQTDEEKEEEDRKQEESQTEEEKEEDRKQEKSQTEEEAAKRNRKDEEEGNGKGEEEEEGEEEKDTNSSSKTETSEEEPSGFEATPTGRRVIRLYQYDEDGRRYAHLPDPAPSDPAPRLKQRSLSLTRLNAIMATASSSPLDRKQEVEPRPHFHMEI
ncbi:high mobility group nucleosome-binding domain-containing protein 5-like [Gouania willdenowi]|uniref:high mobility group nucleosome-binding domain-containing protein 5-like n=1 Tax=Gouania willdenowi TaxID=441366 RepID=UPI001055EA78|nr:high mobility group nucleosome-binding domain-containing protein 5-like [Gouania willdenowi]